MNPRFLSLQKPWPDLSSSHDFAGCEGLCLVSSQEKADEELREENSSLPPNYLAETTVETCLLLAETQPCPLTASPAAGRDMWHVAVVKQM